MTNHEGSSDLPVYPEEFLKVAAKKAVDRADDELLILGDLFPVRALLRLPEPILTPEKEPIGRAMEAGVCEWLVEKGFRTKKPHKKTAVPVMDVTDNSVYRTYFSFLGTTQVEDYPVAVIHKKYQRTDQLGAVLLGEEVEILAARLDVPDKTLQEVPDVTVPDKTVSYITQFRGWDPGR